MHEWFTAAIAASRAEGPIRRATDHRNRVAAGLDLRSRLTQPLLTRATRTTRQLATRREDATVALRTRVA